MRSYFGKLLTLSALAVACLTFTGARAQQYYPPQGQYPQQEGHEREHEHEQDRDRMREEREHHEEHERQDWHADERWRRNQERYFGHVIIQPYPDESYEAFRARMQAQCNLQWNSCATYCNTIGNPYQRAACVNNCNNELYQCRVGF